MQSTWTSEAMALSATPTYWANISLSLSLSPVPPPTCVHHPIALEWIQGAMWLICWRRARFTHNLSPEPHHLWWIDCIEGSPSTAYKRNSYETSCLTFGFSTPRGLFVCSSLLEQVSSVNGGYGAKLYAKQITQHLSLIISVWFYQWSKRFLIVA